MPRNTGKSRWYVAEIVEEIEIEAAADKVVHRNLVLIDAESPDQAYERALEIGGQGESSYYNPQGRSVLARFLGLSELCVVHDELEHGAELLYSEQIVGIEENVRDLIPSKAELSVFRDVRKLPDNLDYSDRQILHEATTLDAKGG